MQVEYENGSGNAGGYQSRLLRSRTLLAGGLGEGLIVYIKSLLLLSVVLLVSACATLDRNDCVTGDWQTIGYNDGARGRSGEFLELHQQACAKHGVSVEEPLYTQGYKTGLAHYCQPETGYRLGRNEEIYNYICPAEFEKDFVTAYAVGLTETMADLQIEENFLESRLWYATVRHRNYEVSYEVDPVTEPGGGRTAVLIQPRVLDSLRNQVDNYRDRRARIRNALARADRFLKATSTVPVSDESAESS